MNLFGQAGLTIRKIVRVSVIIKSLNWLDIEQVSGGCAIIGFECEEGVRRNKGRLGAAKAPNALRSGLANLPWRFPETARLFDVGNIACAGEELETAQQATRRSGDGNSAFKRCGANHSRRRA